MERTPPGRPHDSRDLAVAHIVLLAGRMLNWTARKLAALVIASSFSLGLAGCASEDPDPVNGDNGPPLASYDEIFAGAPPNRMLPDDNKADAIYPAKHSELIAKQSPVKSQGSRGVCSIFATAALMESLYISAGAPGVPDFSEQYLQWSVKKQVGAYPHSSGSNANENLRAITDYGIVEEAAWPYETAQWGEFNDPECKGEEAMLPLKCFTNGEPPAGAVAAMKFKLPRGKYVNTNSIKAHITTKKSGVQVGLDFFYQSWNHRRSTIPVNSGYWNKGYVLAPNAKDVEESHTHKAGHSILIIGWDDELEVQKVDGEGKLMVDADGKPVMEKGFYLFKNSWGTAGFGIENPHGAGYGWLSMKYVSDYGSAYASDLPTLTPVTPPVMTGDSFESTTAVEIPDNSPAGAKSELTVPAGAALTTVAVSVDIAHTYIGDLTVKLVHGDKSVLLHAGTGGGDDNLVKTYTLRDFEGAARDGVWRLEVVDGAAQDVGTLRSWKVVFAR